MTGSLHVRKRLKRIRSRLAARYTRMWCLTTSRCKRYAGALGMESFPLRTRRFNPCIPAFIRRGIGEDTGIDWQKYCEQPMMQLMRRQTLFRAPSTDIANRCAVFENDVMFHMIERIRVRCRGVLTRPHYYRPKKPKSVGSQRCSGTL